MDTGIYFGGSEPPDEQPGCVAALAGGMCAPPAPETEAGSCGAGGSWWRGIMSSARAQSSHVMGFMKRDLGEFVSVVRDDTKDAVHKTAGAMRESVNKESTAAATSRLKSGLTRFLDSVTSAMTIPPDDSDEQPMVFKEGGWHVAKNRREARIITLQADPNTYETAPQDEAYPEFRDKFDSDGSKTIISDILVTNADVRSAYTRLVPKEMLHREFWARYFFRMHALEREEAHWEALKQRAARPDASSSDWGEDWDEDSGAAGDLPVKSAATPVDRMGPERTVPSSEPTSTTCSLPPAEHTEHRSSSAPRPATTEAEAKPQSETEAKPQSETEAKSQNETEAKPQNETEAKPQNETEAKSQSETEAKPQSETEAKSQSETEAKPQSETEAKPQDETEAKPQSETEAKPQSETEAKSQDETEANPGIDFRMSDRADTVVVKHKDSPESSESCVSADPPERRDLEEWEAELDVDVTAAEIEEAKRTARELRDANQLDDEEDWENWE